MNNKKHISLRNDLRGMLRRTSSRRLEDRVQLLFVPTASPPLWSVEQPARHALRRHDSQQGVGLQVVRMVSRSWGTSLPSSQPAWHCFRHGGCQTRTDRITSHGGTSSTKEDVTENLFCTVSGEIHIHQTTPCVTAYSRWQQQQQQQQRSKVVQHKISSKL